MRLAIGQCDGNTGLSFGSATVGVSGNNYVVVFDYTKFTTKSFGVRKTPVAGNKISVSHMTEHNPYVLVPVFDGGWIVPNG